MKKILLHLDNEPMSGLTHFIGFLLAVAGLVVLTVFASMEGSVWHIVSFSIFGASMVVLYAASTVYHFFPITSKFKHSLRRLDEAMVYVLIAGTYTPLCLVPLRGGWGWSLFGIVWGFAFLGMILKVCNISLPKWASLALYLGMGWIAVIAFVPLRMHMPSMGLFLLFLGGILYTLGVIAFAFGHIRFLGKWFGLHEVFHIMVMLGSLTHFVLIFYYLL